MGAMSVMGAMEMRALTKSDRRGTRKLAPETPTSAPDAQNLAPEIKQMTCCTASVKSTTFHNSPPTPLRVLEPSLQTATTFYNSPPTLLRVLEPSLQAATTFYNSPPTLLRVLEPSLQW
jgi:hypothetical protein